MAEIAGRSIIRSMDRAKPILYLILLVVLVGGGYFLITYYRSNPEDTPSSGVSSSVSDRYDTQFVEYFSRKLQTEVVKKNGQPIEGFTPDMFLSVFPGLRASDFDGVEAFQGVYQLGDSGTLSFVRRSTGGPIHSAEAAISPNGMEMLLSNVASRNQIVVVNTGTIDTLIQTLLLR